MSIIKSNGGLLSHSAAGYLVYILFGKSNNTQHCGITIIRLIIKRSNEMEERE
jgi:hypothetical protein